MERLYVTSVMLGIVVALVALAAIAMVAYVIYYYLLAGVLAPTRRVMAKVVLKRQREKNGGGVAWFCEADEAMSQVDREVDLAYDFYLAFEVDGKRLEFAVPMKVYGDVEQGDTGLLVHKGTLFKGFVKRAGDGWSDPVTAPIRRV